jgi:tetratricopeptide (TPR) repeat protein
MNETWLTKTELYVNGGMKEEERLLFEKEMAANELLFSYVNLYRDIETTMRNQHQHNEQEDALKASVKRLNTVYFNAPVKNISGSEQTITPLPNDTRKSNILIWKTFAIAAATIGVIFIGIVWYTHNIRTKKEIAVNTKVDSTTAIINSDTMNVQDKASNIVIQNNNDTVSYDKTLSALTQQKREALFKKNFKTDTAPENIEGPLEDGFAYYTTQQYDEAATEFSTADLSATRGPGTDEKLTAFYAHYYAGISYLAANKTNKAIAALNDALTKSTGTLMRVKTQWYLALAYVKINEVNKAASLLGEVHANNIETEYKLKAGVLLGELK